MLNFGRENDLIFYESMTYNELSYYELYHFVTSFFNVVLLVFL